MQVATSQVLGYQVVAVDYHIGPKVVPFGGSYLEIYKVIPKRNYFGAYGYLDGIQYAY